MRRGRKIALALLASLTAVVVAAAAGYGELAPTGITDHTSRGSATAASTASAQHMSAVVEAATTPSAKPEPEPVLERGDKGAKVRELQHRLSQLAWFNPPMTGDFERTTLRAVRGFQAKRTFEVTGEVDRRTWRRLVKMTRTPTGDEMFNRAGPTLFGPGESGPAVREVQARLRQIAWFVGDVSGSYDGATTDAVAGFQAKRAIPSTGKVDRRTLDLLGGMTVEPTADELANRAPDPADGARLDPRCRSGRALCVDKSSSSLRWVVNGTVGMSVDVRFGSDELPTRDGQFAVSYKSRDHVSSLYDTSMPYAMFFSGGQAVHYSPDFAANGYYGASHGCVNVRDLGAIQSLFDQVSIGDKVIVYWS